MKRIARGLLVGAVAVVAAACLAWAEDVQGAGKAQAQDVKSAVQAAPAEMQATPATAPAAPAAPAPAAATGGLEVVEASIATGIENREPVGVAETFPAGTEKLYCYSKVTGGTEGDEIVHRWLKGTEEMAQVTLKVNGSPWRTFSSKTIAPDMTGSWSVDILQGENVLKTLKFEIK